MSAIKPNLDAPSASRIARGQMFSLLEKEAALLESAPTSRPTKRGAWLRAVEKEMVQKHKDTLLCVGSDKRKVTSLKLGAMRGQFEGWLAIMLYAIHFDGKFQEGAVAGLSRHAIARVMERLRNCDPVAAIKHEILLWSMAHISQYCAKRQGPPFLCIPSATGYFVAKWDKEINYVVFATWLPDRLLNQREQAVLTQLRKEEKIGIGESLLVCD